MKVWTVAWRELFSNVPVVQVMPPNDNLFSYQREWNVTDVQNYGAQLGSLNYEGGLLNCSGMYLDMAFSGDNLTVEVRAKN